MYLTIVVQPTYENEMTLLESYENAGLYFRTSIFYKISLLAHITINCYKIPLTDSCFLFKTKEKISDASKSPADKLKKN